MLVQARHGEKRRIVGQNDDEHEPKRVKVDNDGALESPKADPNLPCPVLYLQKMFVQTEVGNLLLKKSMRCAFVKPSQEFIDAYDLVVVQAIREGSVPKLRGMMEQGKSLNACNRFGESLIHMACRRGDVNVVKFMLEEAKVKVNVRDDFGRTPLHDACWTSTPNFDVMDLLVKYAPPCMLLAEDVRGHSPFHYARKEHWSKWVEFLKERDDLLSKRLSLIRVVA